MAMNELVRDSMDEIRKLWIYAPVSAMDLFWTQYVFEKKRESLLSSRIWEIKTIGLESVWQWGIRKVEANWRSFKMKIAFYNRAFRWSRSWALKHTGVRFSFWTSNFISSRFGGFSATADGMMKSTTKCKLGGQSPWHILHSLWLWNCQARLHQVNDNVWRERCRSPQGIRRHKSRQHVVTSCRHHCSPDHWKER